jgi:hypothetical protein
MGHCACSVSPTPAMSATALWWYWSSINLSSNLKVSWASTLGCWGAAPTFVVCYTQYSTPCVSSTLPEKPPLLCAEFSFRKMFISDRWQILISHYTILNTFKLHARRIWPSAARPDTLYMPCMVYWTQSKIESKTETLVATSNLLKISQIRSLDHRDLLCRGQTHTLAPVLHWAMTLLSHGNAMLMVALRQNCRSIPTTCLWGVKSTNISGVESRKSVWRHTMRMFARKITQICVSEASKMRIASRSLWLAWQMIQLSGSGNYTLSRIAEAMTITHTPSYTWLQISLNELDAWWCRQPTPSFKIYTPQCGFNSNTPPKSLYPDIQTADWWSGTQVSWNTQA